MTGLHTQHNGVCLIDGEFGSMNDRKTKVRLQMQRIIGIFILMIAVMLFFVASYGATPENPEDMGGVILVGILGVSLIFSKKYMF